MIISSDTELFCHLAQINGEHPISFKHECSQFKSNAMHSHTEKCELVMYTEGRKSVYVNNSIYVSDIGCIFTFRPGERHCGLHQPGALHDRYTAKFHPAAFAAIPGGTELLRCFFDREAGQQNMIILPEKETREGFRLLDEIFMHAQRDLPEKNALMLAEFIRYLSLLNRYYRSPENKRYDLVPTLLREIIAEIDAEIAHPIRVSSICAQYGISISTLERLFNDTFAVTPRRFIFQRRIEQAKQMLIRGATVTEACYGTGFGDYSHFIADFRREVGTTPAKYRAAHAPTGSER